jgi:hypothetical protein
LWGDTVNVASRMESSGAENFIQVSENVYQALKENFKFQKRGKVQIKGVGELETYYLIDRAPTAQNFISYHFHAPRIFEPLGSNSGSRAIFAARLMPRISTSNSPSSSRSASSDGR